MLLKVGCSAKMSNWGLVTKNPRSAIITTLHQSGIYRWEQIWLEEGLSLKLQEHKEKGFSGVESLTPGTAVLITRLTMTATRNCEVLEETFHDQNQTVKTRVRWLQDKSLTVLKRWVQSLTGSANKKGRNEEVLTTAKESSLVHFKHWLNGLKTFVNVIFQI